MWKARNRELSYQPITDDDAFFPLRLRFSENSSIIFAYSVKKSSIELNVVLVALASSMGALSRQVVGVPEGVLLGVPEGVLLFILAEFIRRSECDREDVDRNSNSYRLSAREGFNLVGVFFGVVGSSCLRLSARGGASLKCERDFFGDEFSFSSVAAFLGERGDDNCLDEPDSSDPESSFKVGMPEKSQDPSCMLLLPKLFLLFEKGENIVLQNLCRLM
jgi:hypothetical protein